MGGVFVRRAQVEDAYAVATVHVESWRATYRGDMPDEYLDSLKPEDRFELTQQRFADPNNVVATFVGLLDDHVVGFGSYSPSRDEKGCGEVAALYALPSVLGMGVGKALLDEGESWLRSQQFPTAYLWVLPTNDRARRFYGRQGWVCDDVEKMAEVWGVTVPEVRYSKAL